MIEFKGAVKEEFTDPRNYKISRFVPGEDIISDTEFMLPFPKKQIVDNQGQYSACVGHSLAMCKSILEYMQTNKWIDFDPFVIYGTRDYGTYTGEGMVPAEAVKNLYKDGAFFRRDFGKREEVPQIINTVKEWKAANPDKVLAAKDYTITGYSFVGTEYDIKKALKNKMPVSAMFPIYKSFLNTGSDGKVKNDTTGSIFGYHQMTIAGWTENKYWIVVNSWGTSSGLKGIYLIPFTYPIESGIALSDTITPSKHKASVIKLAIDNPEYFVDDTKCEFDSAPFIKNNSTYVPIRFITEALGCSVEWINDTKEVIIRSEEAVIKLTIGSTSAFIDGEEFMLLTAPEIVNNRTMIPIRFICEHLNCDVEWNNEDRTVLIKSL